MDDEHPECCCPQCCDCWDEVELPRLHEHPIGKGKSVLSVGIIDGADAEVVNLAMTLCKPEDLLGLPVRTFSPPEWLNG